MGSRMGSRPLAPDISPNKTVEGTIGGAVPWLLLGNADMPHVGTLDVDLGLDAEALGDGEYATLVEALMGHGYEQRKELRRFQLVRRVLPDAAIALPLHDYYPICANDGQMVTTGERRLCHKAVRSSQPDPAYPD